MGLNNFILTCEKDNEELRKNINYYKNMVSRLKKENQELKNHLKELKNGYKIKLEKLLANGIEPDLEDFYLAEIECKANDYDKLLNQQKEFIKFLEDNYNLEHDIWYIKILQKYKEIIGVSDENN